MLQICPSAARRMDKLLATSCPRPGFYYSWIKREINRRVIYPSHTAGCAGKIEGVKGFKDSVAIREGIFGKGGGRAKEKTDHGLIKKVADKKKDKNKVEILKDVPSKSPFK